MDATVLVGVVLGGPRARDDRMRLPHNALVSALTRRCTTRRKRRAGPSSAWRTTGRVSSLSTSDARREKTVSSDEGKWEVRSCEGLRFQVRGVGFGIDLAQRRK